MCTLSWLPRPGGHSFWHGRDERTTRLPGEPPSVVRRGSRRALAPRDGLDAILATSDILRRDADRVPAAMLALAAARALAAGRVIGPADALYLRSPDVTLSAGPKRVGT